jgi:hypothetical protein
LRQNLPLLYLDTNEAARVFERERAVLYPRLEAAVASGAITLVVSDVLALELLRSVDVGDDRAGVRAALERIDALNPRWLALRNVQMDELRFAYADHVAGRPVAPLEPITPWADAAERIAAELGGDVAVWRAMRMPELLFDAYEAGGITQRLDYWQGELAASQDQMRQEWGAAQALAHALHRVFQGVVEYNAGTFGADNAGARAFATLLWEHPDVCPAFRLGIEATVELLWDRRHDWHRNEFLDLRHAGAVAYVNHFITAETWLRTAILNFDRRRRIPAELDSYRTRVRPHVEEVIGIGGLAP